MQRRTFTTLTASTLIGLAGCTGGDSNQTNNNQSTDTETTETPTVTPTETRHDADSESSGATSREQLSPEAIKSFLESEYDFNVASTEQSGSTLSLAYHSEYVDPIEMRNEIGKVAGTFAGFVDEGYEAEMMDVTILAKDSDHTLGGYTIKTTWAESYLKNDDSTRYFEQIRATLELPGLANILEHEFVEGEYSNNVVGRIENTSGQLLSYLEINAKYYDADGNVIDNGMDNITDLEAGEKYKFKLYAPGEDVNEYTIEWST
jgi:hypothetical protein